MRYILKALKLFYITIRAKYTRGVLCIFLWIYFFMVRIPYLKYSDQSPEAYRAMCVSSLELLFFLCLTVSFLHVLSAPEHFPDGTSRAAYMLINSLFPPLVMLIFILGVHILT
ncbi:MAG: hypothetical protein ACOX81_10325 [Candidatus Heteroscillospira sp.]|jgi:hypothetical protein